MRRAPSEQTKVCEEEEETQRKRRNSHPPPSERQFARKRRRDEVNELCRLRRSEQYEVRADDVPCKLNNAKLSERTKERARWRHRNVMNLSEAEIHSL